MVTKMVLGFLGGSLVAAIVAAWAISLFITFIKGDSHES